MICYVQAKLNPKTHDEINTLIVITEEESASRKALKQKWGDDKMCKAETQVKYVEEIAVNAQKNEKRLWLLTNQPNRN